MTTTREPDHYHCVTCHKRIDPDTRNIIVPLLVCDDNETCYRDTPQQYRRWNGFKYVPDPSRAEPCYEDACEWEEPAEPEPYREIAGTVDGAYGERGEPIVEARLHLPDSQGSATIRMVVSTGTTQSLICAADWQATGADTGSLAWHEAFSPYGPKMLVSDEITAIIELTDRQGLPHRRTIPVRLTGVGDGTSSVAGTDLLRDSILTMEPQKGLLTIDLRVPTVEEREEATEG